MTKEVKISEPSTKLLKVIDLMKEKKAEQSELLSSKEEAIFTISI